MALYPSTFIDTGYGTSSWEDWLRQVAANRQQQTYPQAVDYPTTTGPLPPPSPITTSRITQRPKSSTTTGTPTSHNPAVATTSPTTARTTPTGANASVQAAQQKNVKGTQDIPAGHFFSGMDQTMIDMLRDNPDQIIYEYLKGKGYSPILQSVLGRYDPLSIARALGRVGFSEGSLGQLGARENIMNTLMGGNQVIDPRAIVANIAGQHYRNDTSTNSLAFYLDSTKDVDPNNQVKNVSGIILSALQGIVPDDALKAYANLLNRQALEFLSQRMHDTGHYGRESFIDYLRRVYPGQGLGIY